MNVLYLKVKNIKNGKSKNNIEEVKNGKTDKLFKISEFFKWAFCVIDTEEIFNGYIAKIPIKINKSVKIINNIRNSIIASKIRKIINEKSIDGIVLSDEIKKNTEFMDKFILKKKCNYTNKKKNNISKVNYKKDLGCMLDEHTSTNQLVKESNIKKHFIKQRKVFFIDGKGLFKYIIYEILIYIINIQNRKAELEDIFIVANNIDEIMLDNIIFLSTKFKNINIVSKNIEKYKYIEEIVYNNIGNNVILLNNKRKSLKRAKLIVNVDINNEELNEYLIYRKAIIINLNDETNNKENEVSIIQGTKENVNKNTTKKGKIVKLTGFDGIFVNSYEIDVNNKIKEFFKKYGLINETSITILYESFLNKKENFSKMRSKIQDAGLIIKKLYGNNGIIDENEYKRVDLSDNENKKRY